MAYDALKNYPDYLQDFEEIEYFAEAQSFIISNFEQVVTYMLAVLGMDSGNAKIWKEMADLPDVSDFLGRVAKLHKNCPVVTMEELRNVICCWIDENKFLLEYDAETMTLILKTTLNSTDYNKFSRRVRDVIPCNLALLVEHVDNIG